MGLNLENTNKVIDRFEKAFDNSHYNGVITVGSKSKHGSEYVEVVIDEQSISLRELEDLKEGIHNTMSIGIDKVSGKLYISIW